MNRRIVIIAGSLSFVATPAFADPSPSRPASAPSTRTLAEMLFFTGRGLLEDGRIDEACPKLEESYRLDKASGTLLNMALCHEKQGRIASAWAEFRDAAAEARSKNQAEREEAAESHVRELEPQLSYLDVQVPKEMRVPGLEVTRQGEALSDAALNSELPCDPGKVSIVWSAPGYFPQHMEIELARRQRVAITLKPLEPKPIELPPPPFWTTKRAVGALLGGVGIAGLAGGAVLGLGALSAKNDSNAQCPTYLGQLRCSQQGADDMQKVNSLGWASNAAFAVGAASLAVGSYLFFTGGEKPEQPAVRVGVAPGVGGASGFVSGEF